MIKTFKIKIKSIISKYFFLEFIIRILILIFYLIYKFIGKYFSFNKKRKTILIINHHFAEDINSLKTANKKLKLFNIVSVDNKKVFGIANCFFNTIESKTIEIPYNSEYFKLMRERYYPVAKIIFRLIKLFYKFDIIITPSDTFFWLREFIKVSQEKNIPVIVLDKEGTISPYTFKYHSLKLKSNFPFISDKLYVWSKRQKRYWIRAGVSSDKILVIGQPRSDYFFQPERWKNRRKMGLRQNEKIILFFDYENDAYIPENYVGKKDWSIMRRDTYDILASIALKYPKIQIVIKTHPQQQDIDFIQLKIKILKLNNIKLFTGTSGAYDLILNSDIIIGFQTTALIEAMLTDKPIIYTYWDKNISKFKDDILPIHKSGGCDIVKQKKDLEIIIEKYLNITNFKLSSTIKRNRDRFVRKYFYMPDGKVSERILTALYNEIKR